uniref:Sjoegren syndrome/scleroderma autoantigen 1 homolog n=1 Tax=Phallusia mammillata TaxID=59560 RepID=A0A6F9DX80_9ASCI|nr:Sjoegren syndrome/scleroderma autoantigen 1 homolog [Phallusia mammillata]
MNGFTDEWSPPSSAEIKILEAKRARNDKISKLMADNMLKGYRMLDKLCEKCDTILLQSSDGLDYCVACEELESETAKDDPAVSAEAAAASMQEQQLEPSPAISSTHVFNIKAREEETGVKEKCTNALTQKICNLTNRLLQTDNLEEVTKVCQAIQSCSECLQTLTNTLK